MKKNIFSLNIILMMTLLTLSAYGATGGSGFSSLDMDGSSARQFAMGTASVGLCRDVSTITANPSGLGVLTAPEAGFMMLLGIGNTTYVNGAIAIPLSSKKGVFGFDFMNFKITPFMGVDEFGKEFEDLNMNDYTFSVGYANNPLSFFNMKQDLNIGISLKIGSSRIYNAVPANFIAFDAGLLYKMDYFGLDNIVSIGAAAQNLGNDVTFISEGTKLPLKYKFGFGWESKLINKLDINAAADYIVAPESENSINLGLEFVVAKIISIQGGYKISKRLTDSFTTGMGFKAKVSSQSELNINYALIPAGDLGLTHCISVGFKL